MVASRKAEMASLPQGESNGLNYGLSDEAAPAPGRLQLTGLTEQVGREACSWEAPGTGTLASDSGFPFVFTL